MGQMVLRERCVAPWTAVLRLAARLVRVGRNVATLCRGEAGWDMYRAGPASGKGARPTNPSV
ncbi:MAG: hypothetical protein D6772_07965 [Bacteroidetes bacterium]|nr:MAG: hypothetical protein D6772_07965 [Bacteroidota bacterium]